MEGIRDGGVQDGRVEGWGWAGEGRWESERTSCDGEFLGPGSALFVIIGDKVVPFNSKEHTYYLLPFASVYTRPCLLKNSACNSGCGRI